MPPSPPRPDAGPLDLRARRRELDLPVERVAAALGVHRTSVLRWERGERFPGADVVHGLARELATDVGSVSGYFDARREPLPEPTRIRATGLRALRQRRGWPASTVARVTDRPVSQVFNWETGRSGMPVELVPVLAGGLAMAEGDLLARLREPLVTASPRGGPLRRARVRRGWTQQVLAGEVGVSRHLVGSWEAGRAPALWHQRRLASSLGVRLDHVASWFGTRVPAGLRPDAWRPGDLPQVLRDLRLWSGLTQQDVADRCSRSVSTVASWEAGRSTPPRRQRDRLTHLYRLPERSLEAALPTGDPS